MAVSPMGLLSPVAYGLSAGWAITRARLRPRGRSHPRVRPGLGSSFRRWWWNLPKEVPKSAACGRS